MIEVPEMGFFNDPGFEIMFEAWGVVFNDKDKNGRHVLSTEEAIILTGAAKERAIRETGLSREEATILEDVACHYSRLVPEFYRTREATSV